MESNKVWSLGQVSIIKEILKNYEEWIERMNVSYFDKEMVTPNIAGVMSGIIRVENIIEYTSDVLKNRQKIEINDGDTSDIRYSTDQYASSRLTEKLVPKKVINELVKLQVIKELRKSPAFMYNYANGASIEVEVYMNGEKRDSASFSHYKLVDHGSKIGLRNDNTKKWLSFKKWKLTDIPKYRDAEGYGYTEKHIEVSWNPEEVTIENLKEVEVKWLSRGIPQYEEFTLKDLSKVVYKRSEYIKVSISTESDVGISIAQKYYKLINSAEYYSVLVKKDVVKGSDPKNIVSLEKAWITLIGDTEKGWYMPLWNIYIDKKNVGKEIRIEDRPAIKFREKGTGKGYHLYTQYYQVYGIYEIGKEEETLMVYINSEKKINRTIKGGLELGIKDLIESVRKRKTGVILDSPELVEVEKKEIAYKMEDLSKIGKKEKKAHRKLSIPIYYLKGTNETEHEYKSALNKRIKGVVEEIRRKLTGIEAIEVNILSEMSITITYERGYKTYGKDSVPGTGNQLLEIRLISLNKLFVDKEWGMLAKEYGEGIETATRGEKIYLTLHNAYIKISEELGVEAYRIPTIMSIAEKLIKKHTKVKEIKNQYSMQELLKGGVYGARVERLKKYAENVYHYDVNSLYPAVLKKNYFPVKDLKIAVDKETIEKYISKIKNFKKENWGDIAMGSWPWIGFAYVTLEMGETPYPFISIKEDEKLINSVRGTGLYSVPEICYAKYLGYEIKDVEGIIVQEEEVEETIFETLVEELYEIKKKNKIPFISKGLVTYLWAYYMRTTTYYKEPRPAGLYYVNKITKNNIGISAYVLAYARIYMHNKIMEVGIENVCYTDTDSIFTIKPLAEKDLHEDELGKFKNAVKKKDPVTGEIIYGKLSRAWFEAQKAYCYYEEFNGQEEKDPKIVKNIAIALGGEVLEAKKMIKTVEESIVNQEKIRNDIKTSVEAEIREDNVEEDEMILVEEDD